jgi:hypothetical protein
LQRPFQVQNTENCTKFAERSLATGYMREIPCLNNDIRTLDGVSQDKSCGLLVHSNEPKRTPVLSISSSGTPHLFARELENLVRCLAITKLVRREIRKLHARTFTLKRNPKYTGSDNSSLILWSDDATPICCWHAPRGHGVPIGNPLEKSLVYKVLIFNLFLSFFVEQTS